MLTASCCDCIRLAVMRIMELIAGGHSMHPPTPTLTLPSQSVPTQAYVCQLLWHMHAEHKPTRHNAMIRILDYPLLILALGKRQIE